MILTFWGTQSWSPQHFVQVGCRSSLGSPTVCNDQEDEAKSTVIRRMKRPSSSRYRIFPKISKQVLTQKVLSGLSLHGSLGPQPISSAGCRQVPQRSRIRIEDASVQSHRGTFQAMNSPSFPTEDGKTVVLAAFLFPLHRFLDSRCRVVSAHALFSDQHVVFIIFAYGP